MTDSLALVPYTLQMMSKFLRIALAWLLAVALPIQGYAAQAMLLCGPAHHQSAVASDHASHDHGEASMHDDHRSMASHEDAEASALDSAQDHHAKDFKSGHAGKCSACASCCSAAAIVTAISSVDLTPQHVPVVATIPAGHAHDALGGLDRPPRQFLA